MQRLQIAGRSAENGDELMNNRINFDFRPRFLPVPSISNSQPPLWERLNLPSTLWWMEDLLAWTEQPGEEIIYVTIPAIIFQAVLRLPDGIHIWNDVMARWDAQDFFLMGDAQFGSPAPIGITLDFEGIDFSRQNFDSIDLRHAWLNHSSFAQASLKRARFDFASITATNFSGAVMDGATFSIAFHRPGQPPQGLSAELLKEYEVYEDDV